MKYNACFVAYEGAFIEAENWHEAEDIANEILWDLPGGAIWELDSIVEVDQ